MQCQNGRMTRGMYIARQNVCGEKHRHEMHVDKHNCISSIFNWPHCICVTNALDGIDRSLEGSAAYIRIGRDIYIGFTHHALMMSAFAMCRELGFTRTRLIDPYSIHVSTQNHRNGNVAKSLHRYFRRYGAICSIVTYDKHAYINYLNRWSALSAIGDGKVHRVSGMKTAIRAKYLNWTDPCTPKGYSPARWV